MRPGDARYVELSWGLSDIDDLIGTGYPGRLVVVGARPSNGKTTWLQNWVNRIVEFTPSPDHRVLCFWTEHTPEIAYVAWACLHLGYSLDDAVKGRLTPMAAQLVHEWATEILPTGNVTFAPMVRPSVSEFLTLVNEHQPTVVVFDYIQRVRPEGRQTKFDAIAEMAVALRELAIHRPALVIVGSQLKRRGDGAFDKYRPPHLEDFKGAGEIEEAANIALGLFRPLQRMTHAEEMSVKVGEKDLDRWKIPDCMAVKCLKHHYWPDAADRIVRVRVERSIVTDWRDRYTPVAPIHAGDAWEAPF